MTTDMKPTAFTTTYAPATEESKGAPKGFMLFGVELAYLSFLGGVVAFLGWLVQNTISAATVGVIDSAHVLPFITPFIPVIYALHILLGHPDDVAIFGKPLFASLPEAERKRRSNILAYVIICCAVFFGELAIGNFMDHYFGMQIWDFADL